MNNFLKIKRETKNKDTILKHNTCGVIEQK
jgi:hypothetical protein